MTGNRILIIILLGLFIGGSVLAQSSGGFWYPDGDTLYPLDSAWGININVLTVTTVTVNSAYSLPTFDGTAGQYMTTDGSGNLSWGSVAGGHDSVTLAGQDYLTLSTQQITVGEIEPDDLASSDFGGFNCNGTTCTIDDDFLKLVGDTMGGAIDMDSNDISNVKILTVTTVTINSAYSLPTFDGSAGQVLKTDGSGNLSWTTAGGVTLTEEQVEDYVGGMLGGTETLISVDYQDASNDIDFVVNDDLSLYDNSSSNFITATLTEEEVEDFIGGMLGGTETNISVTYQDASNDIDFVVTDAWWNALTDMVLTDNYIYVGDASNDPVGVAMSNDCSIASNGAITCDHDALDNFAVNEHLDWTASVGTIHTGNYIENPFGASIGDAEVDNNITIDLATLATTLTITDNESTNEANAVLFTAGGALGGGNLGIESDGTLNYNPSTGTLTTTTFAGALTGNASTATALATARTIGGVSFDGTGNITPNTLPVDGTVDAQGEITWDTTTGQLQIYDGSAIQVFDPDRYPVLIVQSPSDDKAFLIGKAPKDLTITDIHCIVDPDRSGETAVIDVRECDSTGDSCSTVDATITCDNDGADDDGSFSNGAIDATDWVLLDIGAVTADTTWLTIHIYYSIDAK